MNMRSTLLDELSEATQSMLSGTNLRESAKAIERILTDAAGGADTFRNVRDRITADGVAIAPAVAVACISDDVRTLNFTGGLLQAVKDTRERLGRAVRVLELGSGPLAPLTTSVASLTDSDEMLFGAIDIHAKAVESVGRVVANLGLEDRCFVIEKRNLSKQGVKDLRPDIVVLETMDAGLTSETQTGLTYRLGRELNKEGVVFLPELVVVKALCHGKELGDLLRLDEDFRKRADRRLLRDIKGRGVVFKLPQKQAPYSRPDVVLETTVRVYKDFIIEPGKADITMPFPIWCVSEDGLTVVIPRN